LYNFHQTAQPPGAPLRQGSARNAQSRFETKTGIPLSGEAAQSGPLPKTLQKANRSCGRARMATSTMDHGLTEYLPLVFNR